ncbi:hypothetical protein U1Q18_029449 [Sarracenia purpurea var. burkii]
MGTKVHCKSYLPGYFSMRDLNEDSSSSNWPLFYGDKTPANGQYYSSFLPRTVTNEYPGADKDILKQTMLEHEAIFKHQVFELHRLYKIQRVMMDEAKRKELHRHQIPMETSSSSSPLVSQMPSEDGWKWHKPTFPIVNSGSVMASVSGAEVISSPLSCTKGNDTQSGRIPSKDCEILEFRPSKVRKKLFDLQLPADEYIDTEEGEQSLDNKMSDISSYPPCRNLKIASESIVKLNFGAVTIDCDGDASRFGSRLRNSAGLADLNEPIQVEEVTLPTCSDACHAEIKDTDPVAKPKSQFLLGLPKEILQNSQHGSNNGTSSNLHVENKGIGREWLSYTYDTAHNKSRPNSFPQGFQPNKSTMFSQASQTTLTKVHQPSEILPSDYSREDLWRERTVHNIDLSERSRDLPNSNHLEPLVASHVPNPYPLVPYSNLDNPWSHSISTWGKRNSNLTQSFTSSQAPLPLNSLGTLSRSSQTSAQSRDIFIDKWDLGGNSGSKPVYESGLLNCNGFYHGSSSGSKDLPPGFPSAGFDYLYCNKDDKVTSEHRSINYGVRSYLKGSDFLDRKPVKGVNLNNVILSKCSSIEVVSRQGLDIIDEDKKSEGHLDVLPWLKTKPADKNEGIGTRRDSNSSELSSLKDAFNPLSQKSETVKDDPKQLFPQEAHLPLCDDVKGGAKRNEASDWWVKGKILGFPILDHPCTPKNESSSVVSTSASVQGPPQYEDRENEGKNALIDINLACDPEFDTQIAAELIVVDEQRDYKVPNFRTHIDLNSFASEEELTLPPSIASTSVNVKIVVDINLEAPAVPETEEEILPVEEGHNQSEMPPESPPYKVEQPQDEAVRIAAEAIFAISSSSGHLNSVETTSHSCEPASAGLLLWFVEVVASYIDDIDKMFENESIGKDDGDNELSSTVELDYFEAMTLKLTEIKEEDYLPKSMVPEIRKVEETGIVSLPNRTRRGQARRGRQRRDFQRDILPGLASLSRHEVTEDLQIFGGMMRATGHPWHSGPRDKNGPASTSHRYCGQNPRKKITFMQILKSAFVREQVVMTCCDLIIRLQSSETMQSNDSKSRCTTSSNSMQTAPWRDILVNQPAHIKEASKD